VARPDILARGSFLASEPAKVCSVLLAGAVSSRPKSCLNPKPHTWFNLAEEGGRVWRIIFFDEDEINAVSLLAAGDPLAVSGTLHIHPATDSQGRRRLAFEVVGKQILILRSRSAAKARATSFFAPPAAGGIIRPRVG